MPTARRRCCDTSRGVLVLFDPCERAVTAGRVEVQARAQPW